MLFVLADAKIKLFVYKTNIHVLNLAQLFNFL